MRLTRAGFANVAYWPAAGTPAETMGQHLVLARAPGEFSSPAAAVTEAPRIWLAPPMRFGISVESIVRGHPCGARRRAAGHDGRLRARASDGRAQAAEMR